MRTKPNQAYVFHEPITAHQILEKAAEILSARYIQEDCCQPYRIRLF